jgi:hypothetical protein
MHFIQPTQLTVALILLLVSLSAQAVYKCASTESGITYSDIPCNASAEKLKQPITQSEKASVKDQYAKEKVELNRLQNLRELRERQDTQILHMQQRSLEAKRKRCQALALDKKWKQEDASTVNLTLKQQEQAQKKLRRATEKYQTSCE